MGLGNAAIICPSVILQELPLPPHLIHLDQGMDPFFAEKLENCILFKGDIHVPVYVKILKSEN